MPSTTPSLSDLRFAAPVRVYGGHLKRLGPTSSGFEITVPEIVLDVDGKPVHFERDVVVAHLSAEEAAAWVKELEPLAALSLSHTDAERSEAERAEALLAEAMEAEA